MSLSTCLRLENGKFVAATGPLDSTLDEATAFIKAGYFKQIQALTKDASANSVVTVYQHIDSVGVPSHLISIWGKDSEMALLVADDPAHYLNTMKEIGWVTGFTCDFPD